MLMKPAIRKFNELDYSSFVATQQRVKNEIIAKGNIPALDYALESASLQLALRLLTD